MSSSHISLPLFTSLCRRRRWSRISPLQPFATLSYSGVLRRRRWIFISKTFDSFLAWLLNGVASASRHSLLTSSKFLFFRSVLCCADFSFVHQRMIHSNLPDEFSPQQQTTTTGSKSRPDHFPFESTGNAERANEERWHDFLCAEFAIIMFAVLRPNGKRTNQLFASREQTVDETKHETRQRKWENILHVYLRHSSNVSVRVNVFVCISFNVQ